MFFFKLSALSERLVSIAKKMTAQKLVNSIQFEINLNEQMKVNENNETKDEAIQ